MIFICTHKPEQIPYELHCDVEIIDNNKSNLPEDYRHLRGMLEVLKRPIPDEVGIFQHRRFIEYGSIPEGYDIVCTKDFGNFNIYNQYAMHHHIKDLELVEKIIAEKKFSEWIRKPNNSETYMHNIFIMRRDDYVRYCSWIFSVLNEYEHRNGSARDADKLAERLTAYWISDNIPLDKRFITKTITIY